MRATQDDKKRRDAILKLLGATRLQRLGDSYALIIPKLWIDANAVKIDNSFYVKTDVDLDQITIEPLDREEINELLESNNA